MHPALVLIQDIKHHRPDLSIGYIIAAALDARARNIAMNDQFDVFLRRYVSDQELLEHIIRFGQKAIKTDHTTENEHDEVKE